MKNKKLTRLLIFFAVILLSAILILSIQVGYKNPPIAKEVTGTTDRSGNGVSAIRIFDLSKLNIVPFAMYTPNEFVQSGLFPGKIENEQRIALDSTPRNDTRGTYRFIILNLDEWDEDYSEKAASMAPYLQGDNSYHFTLYIPAVWSACTVYVHGTLRESVGEISDYNFINYSNFIGETVYHKNATEPLLIDLKFTSRRGAALEFGQLVTIHFESVNGSIGGLSGVPLIGSEKAVYSVVNRDKNILSLISLFAALVLAVFIFLCFLKRTFSYFPLLLIIASILGVTLSSIKLLSATISPYFWLYAKNFFFALIPLSTILALRVKIKKFSLWVPFSIYAVALCVISIVLPQFSISPKVLSVLKIILFSIESIMILILAIMHSLKQNTKITVLINPAMAVVLTASLAFLKSSLFIASNPLFWLLVFMLILSVAMSFFVFFELERKNRYLTANLQNEVSRQTKELKSIIADRDNLLRRVSHDMKKPVRSICSFLSTLKLRETDVEQKKTLGILSRKTDNLLIEFEELGNYAKLNYAAEESSEFNVKTVLERTFDILNPDCIANGIILEMTVSDISVYAKPKCLVSVLNNLIINALEHSDCSIITLSATKKKGLCHIQVIDNGKGIDVGKNIFEPY